MKRILVLLALLAASLAPLRAQLQVLSEFSLFTPAATDYLPAAFGGGQWSADTALSGATTFTIGDFGLGTPGGEAGNGFVVDLGGAQNWSAFTTVELTGFTGAENATPTLYFYFEDAADASIYSTIAFETIAFASGNTTVSAALSFGGVSPANVGRWGFIVSEFDNPAFAFTWDNVQLVGSVSVPEPSTYAFCSGGIMLVFAAIRVRRRMRRSAPAL